MMATSRLVLIASRMHSVNLSLLMNKRNMSLHLSKNLINGQWISAASNEQVAVLNPVDNAVIGQVPDLNASEVQTAIDSAYNAFHGDEWSSLTAKERSALLKVSFTDYL